MSRIKSSLYGVISGIILLLFLVFTGSALYLKYDFGATYMSIMMQAAYALSSLVAGFVGARLYGKNGIVSGAVTGLAVAALCLILSLLFGGTKIGITLLITIVLIIGFGIAGGVLSLNVGKNKSV